MDGNRALVLEGQAPAPRSSAPLAEAEGAGRSQQDERIAVCVIVRKGSDEDLFRYNVGSDDSGAAEEPQPDPKGHHDQLVRQADGRGRR